MPSMDCVLTLLMGERSSSGLRQRVVGREHGAGVELAEDDLVDSPTARLLAAHVKAAQSNPDAVTPRLDAVGLYEQVCETSGWLGGWSSD